LHTLTDIIKVFKNLLLLSFRRIRHSSLLLHREAIPFGPPVFEWFLFRVFRKKVIYDFDDAIWLPDVNGESWIKSIVKCRWKYRFIIKHAHTVIAGNSYLLDYAKKYNPNSILIPTGVDTEIHRPSQVKKPKEKIIIGWTGSSSTMKYLDPVYPVIDEVCRANNATFKIISDKAHPFQSDFFRFIPWNKSTEIEDLQDIDIGLMPLSNDEWSKGKCGFKAIQFMALEIPVLVSPVGANVEIVSDGVDGFYCHNLNDWKINLEKLIQSESLRKQMGAMGRKKVIENYSIESNKEKFFSLFE